MNKRKVLCLILLIGTGCGNVFAGNNYVLNDPNDANVFDPCYPVNNLYWNAGNWSMKVVPNDPTFTYPGNTSPTWLTDVYMSTAPNPASPCVCIIDRDTDVYHIMIGCYGGNNQLNLTGGTLQ